MATSNYGLSQFGETFAYGGVNTSTVTSKAGEPLVLKSDTGIVFSGLLANQELNISSTLQLNSEAPFLQAILVQTSGVTVALPTITGDPDRQGAYRFLFSAAAAFTLIPGGTQTMYGCWTYQDTTVWVQCPNGAAFTVPINGECTVYNCDGEWRISGHSPTLSP